MSDDKPKKGSSVEDADEIREIFAVLNESIPKLISGLIGSLYSPEAALSIAEAIGGFYQKLIEKGIPEAMAIELTKTYVAGLDFAKFMEMASSSGSGGGLHVDLGRGGDDDDDNDDDED